MGYETRCQCCYGSRRVSRHGESIVCPECGGTGHSSKYRRWPNQGQWLKAGYAIEAWTEYDLPPKTCRVCATKLTGRKKCWCGDVSCKQKWWWRMYECCHWIKRTLIVQRGCACQACGEVYESPIVEGGPEYPEPWMLQIDHVVPLIDGGDDSPENLQLLCESCHKAKTKREAADRAAARRDVTRPLVGGGA